MSLWRYIGLVLFAGSTFLGASRAENAIPASPDIRAVLAELKQATDAIDQSEIPLKQVDRIRRWEKLLVTADGVRGAVQVAIANAEMAITRYRGLADKYQTDPAKAEVLAKRIESMQEQADRLVLSDAELKKMITGLSTRLEKLKGDPELQQALHAQELVEPDEAAIKKATSAGPEALTP